MYIHTHYKSKIYSELFARESILTLHPKSIGWPVTFFFVFSDNYEGGGANLFNRYSEEWLITEMYKDFMRLYM